MAGASFSEFSADRRISISNCPFTLTEKTIILNVYNALDHQHPQATVVKISEMCSNMTGVSTKSVYRIVRESKNGHFTPPKTSTGRSKIVIEELDKHAIRRIVHSFYFKKEIPTLDKIHSVVKNDKDLPEISRNKLWKTLRELNFVWGKDERKSLLIEKAEIICWRRKYLRKIKQFRNEKRKIYYLDETWINAGHTVKKMWQDKNITSSRQAFLEGLSTGIKPPSGKGSRLIITHIGNEQGFVEGGLLIFQSKHTGDYHEDMNADVFEEYFEQMLDLIPSGSVIVLDNAPYHSRKAVQIPTTAWRKDDIKKWLSERGVSLLDDMLKKELLALVNTKKQEYAKYKIDDMAEKRQIIVLRTPPYHCELNPIELVWAQVKYLVATQNTTYKISDVEKIFQEAIKHVDSEKWQKCVEHVKEVEKKMWQLDHMLEEEIQPIIIPVGVEDSSTDYSDDEI